MFAKKAGIRIHEFSLGMGPLIVSKRSQDDVLFALRAIPIGGYVSMAGEAVSDALIKKGQHIRFDLEDNIITHIYFDDQSEYEVIDYDLYGKHLSPLYIVFSKDDQEIQYEVSRTCKYMMKKDHYMYVTPEEYSFESKTLFQRFLVIFGGPMMNFILAFVLYLVVGLFMMTPNLDSSEVSSVISGYPSDQVLVQGDVITKIDDQVITSWTSLSQTLSNLNTHIIDIEVLRGEDTLVFESIELAVSIQTFGITNINEDLTLSNNIGQTFGRAKEAGLSNSDVIYKLEYDTYLTEVNAFSDIITFFKEVQSGVVTVYYYENGSDMKVLNVELLSSETLNTLGYGPFTFQLGITPTESYDFLNNLLYPFKQIYANVIQVFLTLGLLFSANDGIGLSDLSGPIGIFSLVSQTSSQGLLAILAFTAFLSVNIGLLNLMPIPALDGGRLVFLAYEGITRKPLSRKLENTINMVMFYALMLMFVYVSYHDILRIIRGLF
jgi:regulator of sigma E protease